MPFAATFPTIGYLVAIAATLSMPILPRSKFIQTMMLNVVGICVGSCIALLTCYCAVQARLHTSIPHQTTATGAAGTQQAIEYSSSASAVAGIWLFFNILVANALRFSRPQLQTPVILYSIFANISGTFAPIFGNMTQSIAFVKMLIEAFLSGFAISTVVHFVVIPMSCRQVFFKQANGWMKLAQAALIKHRAYLAAMERSDMLELTDKKDKSGKKMSKAEAAANEVRNAMVPLAELHAKIRADMRFVKREAAFGKLNADDLDEFFTQLRHLFIPLIGLASVADIFTRITKVRGWVKGEDESKQDSGCKEWVIENENTLRDRGEWNEIMEALHQPFEDVTTAIVDGLNHAAYVFELEKPPKESKQEAARSRHPPDVEAASVKKPGDANFSEHLESRLNEFNQTRIGALRTWCGQRGIVVEDAPTSPAEASQKILEDAGDGRNRRQLYLILYVSQSHDIDP
jgi:Putative ER transporter, 6TM, N-terminal